MRVRYRGNVRECDIEVMCESVISRYCASVRYRGNVRECDIEVMCESAISS